MAFPDFSPCIPVFLKTAAELFGERPLILLNDDRLTYSEANERSRHFARGFHHAGHARLEPMLPPASDCAPERSSRDETPVSPAR